MNRYEKFRVIINADREEYEKSRHFKKISNLVEPTIWGEDLKTFEMQIHFYPTYNLLDNQFSFKSDEFDSYNGKIPYQEYLSKRQIKSLSYYDYAGEKLYRLAIQDESISTDWDSIDPKNLELISRKLINYLSKNQLSEFQEETITELEKLNFISRFCKKKKYEIILFNPDF